MECFWHSGDSSSNHGPWGLVRATIEKTVISYVSPVYWKNLSKPSSQEQLSHKKSNLQGHVLTYCRFKFVHIMAPGVRCSHNRGNIYRGKIYQNFLDNYWTSRVKSIDKETSLHNADSNWFISWLPGVGWGLNREILFLFFYTFVKWLRWAIWPMGLLLILTSPFDIKRLLFFLGRGIFTKKFMQKGCFVLYYNGKRRSVEPSDLIKLTVSRIVIS
jgi:hypothetical protein